MQEWECVIIDSTNEQYAVQMIIKCQDYLKRYPRVDIESVAEKFSTLSPNIQRDWALKYDMKSIVKTCRIQRKIKRDADWERLHPRNF